MPLTAKLSRLFYERLGDEITNELVDWLNQMDSGSRADLHALNELNFSRSDAKMEQRVTELNARIGGVYLDLNAKIDEVAAELNARIDKVAAELNAKIDMGQSLHAAIHKEVKEQTRWFLIAWAAQLAAIVALAIR